MFDVVMLFYISLLNWPTLTHYLLWYTVKNFLSLEWSVRSKVWPPLA